MVIVYLKKTKINNILTNKKMQNDKKPVKKFGMHSSDSLKHGCKQCNCPKNAQSKYFKQIIRVN